MKCCFEKLSMEQVFIWDYVFKKFDMQSKVNQYYVDEVYFIIGM
jgi:hypothetical protein